MSQVFNNYKINQYREVEYADYDFNYDLAYLSLVNLISNFGGEE